MSYGQIGSQNTASIDFISIEGVYSVFLGVLKEK